MNVPHHSMTDKTSKRAKMFQVFKYTIYALICCNFFYFAWEDTMASAHTFQGGVGLSQIFTAFTASLDTVAWIVLLGVFELETYTIEDEDLQGKLQWGMNIVTTICYVSITMACYGYLNKFLMTYGFEPSMITDACAQVGNIKSYAIALDDYQTLTANNCSALTAPFLVNSETSMIATANVSMEMKRVSSIDVMNSIVWLLIVVVLQIDVMLQLRGKLTTKLYKITAAVKAVSYSLLFVAAFYWAYLGDAYGTWDATLWILAFFIIELNLFNWHQEEAIEAKAEVSKS